MVMILDDDEFTRLLTQANPARTPREALPDADALRMKQRILARKRRSSRHAPSPRLAWGAVATAGVAGVAVALGVLAPVGAAVAVTPQPLEFVQAGSAGDILDHAQDMLAEDAVVTAPVREVESVSWALSVDVDEQEMAIAPQWTTLLWNDDLSGHLTVLAGEQYWPSEHAGGQAEILPGDEVLVDMAFEAGQYTTPVAQPVGDSAADVVAMLTAFGMPADPSAGDVVVAAYSALDQWTLTDEQHAQLLAYLESRGGVEALGTTTDRLGRAVDALSIASDTGVDYTVLLSRESGRIVGVEKVQSEGDGIIPAGAVVSYRLWDLDEGKPE